jgi:hypothetical protein
MPYRPMVTGMGVPSAGASIPIGNVSRYSWMKASRDTGGVVLKDRVKADHLEICVPEQAVGSFRLRRAVRDATRAEHLERVQKHDAPTQARKRQGFWRVEPACNHKFGSLRGDAGHCDLLSGGLARRHPS